MDAFFFILSLFFLTVLFRSEQNTLDFVGCQVGMLSCCSWGLDVWDQSVCEGKMSVIDILMFMMTNFVTKSLWVVVVVFLVIIDVSMSKISHFVKMKWLLLTFWWLWRLILWKTLRVVFLLLLLLSTFRCLRSVNLWTWNNCYWRFDVYDHWFLKIILTFLTCWCLWWLILWKSSLWFGFLSYYYLEFYVVVIGVSMFNISHFVKIKFAFLTLWCL